jgi:hypothetical protein
MPKWNALNFLQICHSTKVKPKPTLFNFASSFAVIHATALDCPASVGQMLQREGKSARGAVDAIAEGVDHRRRSLTRQLLLLRLLNGLRALAIDQQRLLNSMGEAVNGQK